MAALSDFTVDEMLDMQRRLQERYSDIWEGISPEVGRNKLLWMIGEIGEVIEVIKKRGHEPIMDDAAVRAHFVEEMADVLMYYNDMLLCYGITSDELKQVYADKFKRNMTRW